MKTKIGMIAGVMAMLAVASVRADTASETMANSVSNYVAGVMKGLQSVAEKQPTVDSFREQMKSFMDANFVIRAVYYRRDFLAVGFDLKRVGELDYFWKLMQVKPEPQLSEPGHGSLIQPRLVAMRYPIVVNGTFKGIVSVMLHTDAVLDAVGLGSCSAFKIVCLGKLAEEKGTLAPGYHESKLALPSTEWVIQFQK